MDTINHEHFLFALAARKLLARFTLYAQQVNRSLLNYLSLQLLDLPALMCADFCMCISFMKAQR
jgi:hypothetical protein